MAAASWGWAGVMLALCACPTDTASEARAAMRVPLPEGWQATSAPGGLQVGPSGRVVLQLESMGSPLPALEQLVTALEREKVVVLLKASRDPFVGVRYRFVESSDEGFLGVRRTGGGERRDGGSGRTIWCATTRGAKPDEVEAAMKVCEGVSEAPESTTR